MSELGDNNDTIVSQTSDAKKPIIYISYDSNKPCKDLAYQFMEFLNMSGSFSVLIFEDSAKVLTDTATRTEKISEMVKLAGAIVVFYNEQYQQSPIGQREATLAADLGKHIVFVKAQNSKFKLEDWFYAVRGGRPHVDYFDEPNPQEKIRWHVNEFFDLNTLHILSAYEQGRFIPINVQNNAPYFKRKATEERVLNEIQSLCAKPDQGVLVIAGDGGVGKTTLIEHIFCDETYQDFLLHQCGSRLVVWLNCFEWQHFKKDFPAKERRAFVSALLDRIKAKLDPYVQFNRIAECVSFFKRSSQSVIFVLDDVFNANLLHCLRKICPDSPCIAITRYPKGLKTKEFPGLIKKVLWVEEFSEDDIVSMLQTTFSLHDKFSSKELASVAIRCSGLPLIASLLAAALQTVQPPEEYTPLMTSTNISNLNVGGPHGTVLQLFEFSLKLLSAGLQQSYYAFLLFDPAEPVCVGDLAILWNDDSPTREKTTNLCETFAERSLIRKATSQPHSDEECWMVHEMLHEAALKTALSTFKVSEPDSLSAFRLRIITACLNPTKKPSLKKLCEAIKQRRLALLIKIIARLTAEDLAKLARLKCTETNGMTFLHYLYTVDWPENKKSYLGASISYRLIREVIFKLREYNVNFIPIVKEEDEPIKRTGKPKSLVQHIFADKDAWKYTPDRNSLIDILGQSLQKYSAEKKWEDSFCINDAFKRFLSAIKDPDGAAFEYFINSYDAKAMTKSEQTELIICAARKGNVNAVLKLSTMFPDAARVASRNGTSALMMAAANGHLPVVQFLCERYMETVGLADDAGFTALTHATFNGHLGVVSYLLPKTPSAFVKQKDRRGWIPLMYAASNGHLNIVEYICEICPDAANFQDDNSGLTPMMQAARCGHATIVETLYLMYPPSVQLLDKDSWTAFMFAVSGGHIDVVEYLYECYSEAIQIADKNGLTPLMCAARYGYADVVSYLYLKDPYAIIAVDKDGRTAMMHASASGHIVVVEEIRTLEASVRSQTARATLPSMIKRSERHLATMQSSTY